MHILGKQAPAGEIFHLVEKIAHLVKIHQKTQDIKGVGIPHIKPVEPIAKGQNETNMFP